MAQLELDTRMDINSIGRYVIRFFSHFFQLMPVERVSKLKHHQCGMSFHFRFLKLLSPSISDGIYEED